MINRVSSPLTRLPRWHWSLWVKGTSLIRARKSRDSTSVIVHKSVKMKRVAHLSLKWLTNNFIDITVSINKSICVTLVQFALIYIQRHNHLENENWKEYEQCSFEQYLTPKGLPPLSPDLCLPVTVSTTMTMDRALIVKNSHYKDTLRTMTLFGKYFFTLSDIEGKLKECSDILCTCSWVSFGVFCCSISCWSAEWSAGWGEAAVQRRSHLVLRAFIVTHEIPFIS